MDLKIQDHIALVTGSTLGIGKAIAARLLREGATVFINGRSQSGVDAAVKELAPLARTPRHIRGVAADVSTAQGAQAIFAAAPEADILINNAGIYAPKAFEDITDDDWLSMFNINVLSGVRLSRYYLPRMIKADRGRIVFVSSESGVTTPTEMIHYGTTKTAQLAISRGLAQRCVGTKVTVNSVLPGPTWSEGVEQFVADVASSRGMTKEQVETEFFQTVRPASLLKRFISVEEIADTVAFVVSPLAAATNGASIRCEGGIIPTIA